MTTAAEQTERSIDEIFAARRAADPWPILQQAAVDQARDRLAPLAARARNAIPIVREAQAEGAACLRKYIDRQLKILPIEISELSGLCGDQLDVVESALAQFEGLSIADAADSLNRWPIDVSMLDATVNNIEGALRRVLNKEFRIRQLVAQIETGTNELAASLA